jgi:NAD(P)-dependent dehydrogenase (short-subunit alcohol dehydrogenase family)
VLPGPVLGAEGEGPAAAARDRALTLVRRADEPQWLAHAALFLLENPFVTGVCVPVDGGRTIYAPGDDGPGAA